MLTRNLFQNRFLEQIKARPHLVLLGLFFLGFFHYTEPSVGGLGLEVPNNNAAWIGISLIISLGFYRITQNKKIIYTSQTICLLVCICLLSIPALFPGSILLIESPIHLTLYGGFLFYISLLQFGIDKNELNLILFLMLMAAIIESLIGWHYYLGISWSNFTIIGPGSDVPYGALKQRNSLSTLFVTGLLISAWLLDSENRKCFPDSLQKKILTLLVLAPIILIPIIVILKSRTGWVSGIVCFTLVLPCLFSLRTKKIIYTWIAAAILGFMITPAMDYFSEKTEVVIDAKLNLGGPRTFFYEQVFDLALDKPFVGHGFGNFENEYTHFSADGYANGKYDTAGYANLSHPHNEIIYWWIEGGIFGLAGMLLVICVLIGNIFKLREKKLIVWVLALFGPIFFHTQMEIPFYTTIVLWFVFIILILMIDVQKDSYKQKSIHFTLLSGVIAFLVPVLISAFMITNLQSGRLINRIEQDMRVELSILEGITNPVVWQDRLMWDMNFGLLALSIYQNRPELAENYIAWAKEIIKRKPRAGYYQFLVVAYKVVGDEAQVHAVRTEANYLFPDKDFDLDISVFQGMENKNIEEVQTNMIAE